MASWEEYPALPIAKMGLFVKALLKFAWKAVVDDWARYPDVLLYRTISRDWQFSTASKSTP